MHRLDDGDYTKIATAIYDMDGTTRSNMSVYGHVFVTSERLNDAYSGNLACRWGDLHMDLTGVSSWTADELSRISIYSGGGIAGSTKLILQGALDTRLVAEPDGQVEGLLPLLAEHQVDQLPRPRHPALRHA